MKISSKYLLIIVFLSIAILANAQKHPYLIFTKNRVELLKERIKTDTSIANNWNEIIQAANGFLIKENPKDNIDYLSIAWLVTNDKKYAEKIKSTLIKLCSRTTWANEEMLQRIPAWTSDLETARNCWDVALGYDAIYDQLSKDEKK